MSAAKFRSLMATLHHKDGQLLLVMLFGWGLTWLPPSTPWLRLTGWVIYVSAGLACAAVVVADAWGWLRSHTLRQIAGTAAWWAGYVGPLWWLLLVAGWWPPTAIAVGLTWAVLWLVLTGVVGGFIRASRHGGVS